MTSPHGVLSLPRSGSQLATVTHRPRAITPSSATSIATWQICWGRQADEPFSALRPANTPRRSTAFGANIAKAALGSARMIARRWRSMQKKSRTIRSHRGSYRHYFARPPWSLASIFRRSTQSICATCHPHRPTTPSAAVGPGAVGSQPWCSHTAPPRAPTISITSEIPPRW